MTPNQPEGSTGRHSQRWPLVSAKTHRYRWAWKCFRSALAASRSGRIVVPIAFTPGTAAKLVDGGISLSHPIDRLYAEGDQGQLVLFGSPANPYELVSDPAVQKTLARSLDLLEACSVVDEQLPPIVAQAVMRLDKAVNEQQQAALGDLS